MCQTHIDNNPFYPHPNLLCKPYYCQHFANGDTKSQRVKIACPQSCLTLNVVAPDSSPDNVAPRLCSEHTSSVFTLSKSEGFPYLGNAYCTQDLPGKEEDGCESLSVKSSALETTAKDAAGQGGCLESEHKDGHHLWPKQLNPQVIHSPARTRESTASPDGWWLPDRFFFYILHRSCCLWPSQLAQCQGDR